MTLRLGPIVVISIFLGIISPLATISQVVPAVAGAPPAGPTVKDRGVEELFSLPNQPGIGGLAYSPDGATLATVGSGASVWLRDADDIYAEPVVLPTQGPAEFQAAFGDHFPIAHSPDGALLAVGREDGTVLLWDITRPDDGPRILRIHSGPVQDLAFSPDGTILATGSLDETVRLSDMTDTDTTVIRAGGLVSGVAISPDGTMLAAALSDKTVKLWRLDDPGAEPVVLEGHESAVVQVAFSPDGDLLASGSDDDTVRIWNLVDPATDPVVLAVGHYDNHIQALAFSPDGTTVAAGGSFGQMLFEGLVWLWDLRQPDQDPEVISLGLGAVNEIAWRPASSTLAATFIDGTVRLVDTTDLEASQTTVDYPDAMVVAMNPDATSLAATGSAGEVWLWDFTQPGSDPDVLAAHIGQVAAVAFSPDGTSLATGGGFEDGTVRLWDRSDIDAEPLILSLGIPVSAVAFSPDGTTLAIALWDDSVRLWDLTRPDATPATLQTDEGRRVDDPIMALAFSPDGRHLAGADSLGAMWLWDVAGPDSTPALLTHEHEGDQFTDPLYAIAFSPDGHILVAAGQDEHLLMWDLAHVRPVPVDLAPPEAPEGADPALLAAVFTALGFSPDGGTLVAGGINRAGETTLLMWQVNDPAAAPVDLAVGQAIGSPIWQIAFGTDGSSLTTATMAGAVHRWSLAPPVARRP